MKIAERMCGKARYGNKPDREEWWWTEEVQTVIEEKRETRKELELQPSPEARRRYKIAKTAAKWAVKQAKERAEDDLYNELENEPLVARKKIYKLAKTRKEGQEDKVASPFIDNIDGVLQVEGDAVKERWREYFDILLNEENPFTVNLPITTAVDDPQSGISIVEVKAAISKMKRGKAAGPDEITLEMALALGEEGIVWLHRVMDAIWKEKRMPDDWLKSILVPTFKNKGNIHMCGNYRGIKLLSQIMKCFERICFDNHGDSSVQNTKDASENMLW